MKRLSLLQLTCNGFRYLKWPLQVAIIFFFKSLAIRFNIAPMFFRNMYSKFFLARFKKKNDKREPYFDINGALLPDISTDKGIYDEFASNVFDDVFLISCFYNDNYDKTIVDFLDQYMAEGPYGYTDSKFDVTIKKDDVVIDAGAWIGDFSAYAASKNAIIYAFEPVDSTFQLLSKTAALNRNIIPVKKGLGSEESELKIYINKKHSGANSLIEKNGFEIAEEKISITTLDKFVVENKLQRVDFIKADIEGAERDLLKGATQVLKTFAPKLAFCTYHLPDDPEVLKQLILEANPNYKIVQLKKKLFAAVF